ncbi:MAG: HEAT repeat domain-containing protein, partial [Planctomycetota bacterium]
SKSVEHIASRTYWKVTGDSEKAVKKLIALTSTMEFAMESMDILGEMGEVASAAVPALIKQLSNPEVPYREAAIYALAKIGTGAEPALPKLKSMNSDKDVLIQAAAQDAIKKIEAAMSKAETSSTAPSDTR